MVARDRVWSTVEGDRGGGPRAMLCAIYWRCMPEGCICQVNILQCTLEGVSFSCLSKKHLLAGEQWHCQLRGPLFEVDPKNRLQFKNGNTFCPPDIDCI